MTVSKLIKICLLVTVLCAACDTKQKITSLQTSGNLEKPNVIYILADDLGYGELGSYGQELIETPHLDQLAANGVRFTQHYSGAPVCAPARCILLTGQHAGHAYVRGNHEWKERGNVWGYQDMFDDPTLEGQWPMPDSIYTIAELMKENGYVTGMVGKWGLGAPGTVSLPNKQGFDFFYGYNCQRQAHTLYPMHLWRNETRHLLNNKNVAPHTKFAEGADVHDPSNYEDFALTDYAPELMHTEALQFIKDNHSKPFFLYYASPLPHVPLQAPQRWVDYYKAKLGPEEPYTSGNYFPNQTPRATYAAMISYLDEQVGDLVQSLKTHGCYENTLILFSSDNGPTYAGGADTEFFKSAAPFETVKGKIKGHTNEGGIRVPMIAAWPKKIAPGRQTAHQSSFYDLMPTLSQLLNIDSPPTDGISFLPTLLGKQQMEHDFLYWEFPAYTGQQAVRMGKWKGIRKNLLNGEVNTELYDLDKDPQEFMNLASQFPEIIKEIENIMRKEHTPSEIERFRFEALGD